MALQTSRLDRFVAKKLNISRRDVRLLIAKKSILIDGFPAKGIDQIIDTFSHIEHDKIVLQANQAYYIMVHKPVGVVCATKDDKHQTVIDLLPTSLLCREEAKSLHIVGRLDLNTSGLVLLTNDSRWSEKITSPEHKVAKQYLVTLQDEIANEAVTEYITAFAAGMYFGFEDITTKPAKLEVLASHYARVTLIEGRYHQIKRMFGRFQNKVIGLHRESVGALLLDPQLEVGQCRELKSNEVTAIFG